MEIIFSEFDTYGRRLDFPLLYFRLVPVPLSGDSLYLIYDDQGNIVFERNSGTRLIPDLDFLKKLRNNWSGNLYVKGITSLEDAYHSINCGCTGIYISNHGGRQLESVPSTLDLLKIIRRKIGKKYPILFDARLL